MVPPDENAWDAWSPTQLASKLKDLETDWYVVGGWALDLWHGSQQREHDDLEFAVSPQNAATTAAHLSELTFFEANAGELLSSDLGPDVSESSWQFWGADLTAGQWRVDMMLERGTTRHWQYKRAPDLTQRRDHAVRISTDGIRYLAPANVLLFKAKYCREKDELDFEAALPRLSAQDRHTLHEWLTRYHPGHKWVHRLK